MIKPHGDIMLVIAGSPGVNEACQPAQFDGRRCCCEREFHMQQAIDQHEENGGQQPPAQAHTAAVKGAAGEVATLSLPENGLGTGHARKRPHLTG